MTVDHVNSPSNVRCVWFAGKKRESANFSTSTLDLVEDEAGDA